MALFEQGHAISIGVGAYREPALRAPITVADARGVADALADPAVGAYPAAKVMLLHDDQATRAGVMAALRQLADRVTPADTVVLFFCGHGILGEDGLYYFTTQDTALTPDNQVRAGTGLSGPEILDLLRAIKAQKLLFLINACFSGHLNPTLGPEGGALGAPPSAALGVQVLATGEGRALITASRPTQYSYYRHEQPHTYFGQALIDGLRGQGVPDRGGYVGLFELYQHVYERVSAASGRAQEPVLTLLQGVGPFPVALYPGAAPAMLGPAPIQQTPPPGTAVEVVDRAVVQAIGREAQALGVRAGRDVVIGQRHTLIDVGQGNWIGGAVTIGDVAGGNITKIMSTPATVAAARDDRELVGLIDQLRADVTRLTDAPEGRREDADYELSKAREASLRGDRPRLLEKLEGAQKILLSLGQGIAAALTLAETIGSLIQRVMGWGR